MHIKSHTHSFAVHPSLWCIHWSADQGTDPVSQSYCCSFALWSSCRILREEFSRRQKGVHMQMLRFTGRQRCTGGAITAARRAISQPSLPHTWHQGHLGTATPHPSPGSLAGGQSGAVNAGCAVLFLLRSKL